MSSSSARSSCDGDPLTIVRFVLLIFDMLVCAVDLL
jgi:hypothetical protein